MATYTKGKPLSAVPNNHGELLSSYIRTEGEFPRTQFIAVFEYPDCTREYSPSTGWHVTNDKRVAILNHAFFTGV